MLGVMAGKLRLDLTGLVFGRLTVQRRAPRTDRRPRWVCRCSCGGEAIVLSQSLRSGETVSCGCYKRERATKHGGQALRMPEYRIWRGMRARCGRSPSNSKRHLYADRGIRVCERWESFENFLADMGRRPSVKHSIDRINGNGHYEPSNCRWATPTQQSRNRRTVLFEEHEPAQVRWLVAEGVSVNDVAKFFGASRRTIRDICAGAAWADTI